MHELALEVVDSWDLGVLPAVEDAASVIEDVTGIFEGTVRTDKLQFPLAAVLIPGGALDFRIELDILFQIVLRRHILEILPNLRRARVIRRPVRIPGPGKLIAVARNVTCAARVAVLEPGAAASLECQRNEGCNCHAPADVMILLVNLEFIVLESMLGFESNLKTSSSSSHTNDANVTFGEQRLLCDTISVEVSPVVPLILMRSITGWDLARVRRPRYLHDAARHPEQSDRLDLEMRKVVVSSSLINVMPSEACFVVGCGTTQGTCRSDLGSIVCVCRPSTSSTSYLLLPDWSVVYAISDHLSRDPRQVRCGAKPYSGWEGATRGGNKVICALGPSWRLEGLKNRCSVLQSINDNPEHV